MDELPTAVGSVVKCTFWHGEDKSTNPEWIMLLTESGYQFACDTVQERSAYAITSLNAKADVGDFKYVVLIDVDKIEYTA